MSNVIDSLELQLQGQSRGAESSIDSVTKKLNILTTTLVRLDTKGLQKFASGISLLSSGMQGLNGIKVPDYKRVANGLKSFELIDGKKIGSINAALVPLASSLNILGSVHYDNGKLNSFVNGLSRLANANIGNTQKFVAFGNAVKVMVSNLANTPEISKTTSSLVNGLARLANAGEKASAVASSLPSLSRGLIIFFSAMSRAPVVSTDAVVLTSAVAKLASAGNRTADTSRHLRELSIRVLEFINSLKSAPTVNASIIQLLSALGNIASAGNSANSSLRNITNSGTRTTGAITKLTNGFKKLTSNMSGMKKTSKGLASSFGMFYAKFFMVIRAVKKLGLSISSAQNYIEEFNYFSVALNKVGQDSSKQFKEAGYDSAEAYADSFKTRFATLQKQMTGYDVDFNSGNAISGMSHSLGLDLTEVMNYNAAITQITNSSGMLGETSIATSKALSMLAADWSSLSNQMLSDVMGNFQSGLVGQSRALYKYGIDITSAGLAQTAFNHGLDVSIKDLSQQSKMQLRVLTMLEQSKVAYGDLARTINQPANQLRMLQAGFKKLSLTIGSLFMPVIQKLYPYLNAIVLVLQDFAQWISKMTGIKLGDVEGGVSLPDYGESADDMDDLADSTDKASKKQKKLNDNIQKFDVLNKLNADDSDSGDDDDKSKNIDLSKDIEKALANYEKIWNKAFKDNQNKAVQLAQKIKQALLDGWRKGGDFEEIGSALANWVNKGLEKIPWEKIKRTIRKVAKSLATFLNGFIKDLDWKLVGKTLAEGFNTGLEFLYTFLTTFDFLKFGKSIGTGINSAIKNLNWKLLGKTLGAKLRGVVQFAFGLVTSFDFSQFGKKIGDAVNGFFEDMGKVDGRTGLTGWQEMGKTISDSVKGILDTINTALEEVDWSKVGKAIGEFLGEIDWVNIFDKLSKVMKNAFVSLFKTVFAAIKESPEGVLKAVLATLGSIFMYKKLTGLATTFKALFSNAMTIGILKVHGLTNTFSRFIGRAISSAAKSSAIINGAYNIARTIGTAISTKLGAIVKNPTFIKGIGLTLVIAAETKVAIELIESAIDTLYDAEPSQVSGYTQGVIDDVKKKIGGLDEAVKRTKTLIGEIGKGIDSTDGTNIEDLANKYYNLSQKAKPTASETALLKHYSSELSKLIPGLSENIDKQTGKFNGSKKELKELVSEYKRVTNAQIAYNAAVSLYTQKESNETELANAKAVMKELENRRTKLQNQLNNLQKLGQNSDNSKSYRDTMTQLSALSGELMTTRTKIAGLNAAQDSIGTRLKKNNNIMDNSKISMAKYEKKTAELKGTMSSLSIESNTQNKVLTSLRKAFDDGEISWKTYKELTGKNYKSTKQLNNEIKKVTGKSVIVEAKTKGTKNVSDATKAIKAITGKNVTVSANVEGEDDLSGMASKISQFEDKKVHLGVGFTAGTEENLKNTIGKWGGFSVNVDGKFKKGVEEGLIKKAKGWAAVKVKFQYAISLEEKTNFLKYGKLPMMDENTWKSSPGFKYIKNMPLYKTGGFPEDGMFMANHGELVGRFANGKTAVANNEQITQGFANGITATLAPAVYSAVKQAINDSDSNGSNGNGDVYLDGEKVTKSVVRHVNRITKETSKTPFWGIT